MGLFFASLEASVGLLYMINLGLLLGVFSRDPMGLGRALYALVLGSFLWDLSGIS